jgi:nucleoid-associated protein YgaU
VVAAGDCLWLIAARRLRADASLAEVAAETHRWYDANAAVIGGDPALLRPGQVLAAPADRH